MLKKACGCTPESCGCCEGTRKMTPRSVANRPGLDALDYRVGTHGAFLATMKAALAPTTVTAPGADGQTIETFRPLAGLTTREAGDLSIALLDGWATAADVLTFYQERIANEGYLRTATERRSILELARLVGYELRPGVASTVFLAYTLEEEHREPVEIPLGARSQSVPGPDELPQAFETSEKLVARAAWNALAARRSRPQNITFDNALTLESIYLAGSDAALARGDQLLLLFGDENDPDVVRTVASSEARFADEADAEDLTTVSLQPIAPVLLAAAPLLAEFVDRAGPLAEGTDFAKAQVELARQVLHNFYLGSTAHPKGWPSAITDPFDNQIADQILELFERFKTLLELALEADADAAPDPVAVTDPSLFVGSLLEEPIPQARSGAHLGRSLRFAAARRSDVHPQLLVNFAPRLRDTYYRAWSSAVVNDAVPALEGVYALRLSAPLFGAGVPKQATFTDNVLDPPSDWDEWTLDDDESATALYLDQGYQEILADGYVLIATQSADGPARLVRRVTEAGAEPRTAYGVSGQTTRLAVDRGWWSPSTKQDIAATLRRTLVHANSDRLTLAEEPVTGDVEGGEIELGGLYEELTSGRWVILSGERADIEAVDGVTVAELLMISGLRHEYDPDLPGDTTHTTLVFATDTAYVYKRDTLRIYANVVKATHGETRRETLGSGDASQPLQAFELKQPPLTFVPAATAAGAESTLEVWVNEVRWHEAAAFNGLGANDRRFVTKTDDEAKTQVIFGNGDRGARLPTGVENVRAVYRGGIGRPGNVKAGQISLLQSRPLGVREVINPLPAAGGADRENRDQARESAPLAVMALDRLVSLRDYADFARTFAGIAKADARRLSDGRRQLVHLTVAGIDDVPIDADSDLYRNLLAALRQLGDPDLPVHVDRRELLALVLSARVRIGSDHLWDSVSAAIRSALLDAFGFQRRALGQPVYLSEVIGVIQGVRGVAWVDVDSFGGVPEKTTDDDGARRLLTLDELADAIGRIAAPEQFDVTPMERRFRRRGPAPAVMANVAGFEQGTLQPAQVAIFSPDVPDVLILNQIP